MFQWQLLVEGTEFYPYLPGLEDSLPRDFRDQVHNHWSICNSPYFSEKMENIFKYRTLNIIIFIFSFYHVKEDTAEVNMTTPDGEKRP